MHGCQPGFFLAQGLSQKVWHGLVTRVRRRLKTDAAGVLGIGALDQNRQTPTAPDAEPVACLDELAAMHASRHRRHQLMPTMNAKMILPLDGPVARWALEPGAIVRSEHRRWSRHRPGVARRKGCQHFARGPKPTFQARIALSEHVIEQRRYVAADRAGQVAPLGTFPGEHLEQHDPA